MKKKKKINTQQVRVAKKLRPTVAVEISPLVKAKNLLGIGKYVQFIVLNLVNHNTKFEFVFFEIRKNQNIQIYKMLKESVREKFENSHSYNSMNDFLLKENIDSILWTSPFEECIESLKPAPILVFAIIFDLIPLFRPFDFRSKRDRRNYLAKIKELDSVICFPISSHTKNEMAIHNIGVEVTKPLGVGKLNKIKIQKNDKPEDQFFLVHGGEHPRKNLDFVVKNWIKGGFSTEFSIKILGDISSESKKRIESIASRSLSDVIFLGYVSEADMVDLYASAELVICPSLNEGLGLPAIDALNLSKKAVFSDIPSHREFIPNDCTFFNPRIGSSFIRAIGNEIGSKEIIRRKLKNDSADWYESVMIIFNSFGQKMINEK